MKKISVEVYVSGIFLLVSIFLLFQAFNYPFMTETGAGPGYFPIIICIALLIFSALYFIISIKKNNLGMHILPSGEKSKKILYILGLTVGFVLIVPFTGFVVAGLLFLALQFRVNYKWRSSIIGAVIGILVIYLIFGVMLKVDLPVNELGF